MFFYILQCCCGGDGVSGETASAPFVGLGVVKWLPLLALDEEMSGITHPVDDERWSDSAPGGGCLPGRWQDGGGVGVHVVGYVSNLMFRTSD